MLKSKISASIQEGILPDFPDDDNTVTTTVTKSRRVSFGTNFVKEFIVGSAVSAQCIGEYEQAFPSSDSSNADSSHSAAESEILDHSAFIHESHKVHKITAPTVSQTAESEPVENRPKPPKFSSTICFSADSPTADMEFTEGCLTLAKSILDKKNKEMTVIIQAKPKETKDEEKIEKDETKYFDGSQFEMSVTRCLKPKENKREEKRFESEKTKIYSKFEDDMSITRCNKVFNDDESDSSWEDCKENRMPLDLIMRHLDKDDSDLENDLFNPEKSFNNLLNPFDLSNESEKLNLNESMDISTDFQPNVLKNLEKTPEKQNESKVSGLNFTEKVNSNESMEISNEIQEGGGEVPEIISFPDDKMELSEVEKISVDSEPVQFNQTKPECENISMEVTSFVIPKGIEISSQTESKIIHDKSAEEEEEGVKEMEEVANDLKEAEKVADIFRETEVIANDLKETGGVIDTSKETERVADDLKETEGATNTSKEAETIAKDSEEAIGERNFLNETERVTDTSKEVERVAKDLEEAIEERNVLNETEGITDASKEAEGVADAFKEAEKVTDDLKETEGLTNVAKETEEIPDVLQETEDDKIIEEKSLNIETPEKLILDESQHSENPLSQDLISNVKERHSTEAAADISEQPQLINQISEIESSEIINESKMFQSFSSQEVIAEKSSEFTFPKNINQDSTTEHVIEFQSQPDEVSGNTNMDEPMEICTEDVKIPENIPENSTNDFKNMETDNCERENVQEVMEISTNIQQIATESDSEQIVTNNRQSEFETTKTTEEFYKNREPSLIDLKVIENLKEQSKEPGCVWSLKNHQHPQNKKPGFLSFDCGLLESTTNIQFLLKVSNENSLDSCSIVTNSEITLNEEKQSRLSEYELVIDFGFEELKKSFNDRRHKVENIRHIPYFLDEINTYMFKMNSYLRQIHSILTLYPGSRLKGSLLSFRLYSFPIFFSSVVSIDLKNLFRLSNSSLSFENHFGSLDESKIRMIFQECLRHDNSLCEFVIQSTRYLFNLEKKSGYVSKRSHIRLLPVDLKL